MFPCSRFSAAGRGNRARTQLLGAGVLNLDPATWPPFPGPGAPEALRLRWAVERFLPQGGRTDPTPVPASSSLPAPAEVPAPPVPRPDPDDLARVLGLPLDQLDRVVIVRVPWLDVPLWFVPDEANAQALIAAGEATRGAVWTARELLDLLAVPGLAKDQARTVALAKLQFDGDVVTVRRRDAAQSTLPFDTTQEAGR